METKARNLFERYERFINRALTGEEIDLEELAAFYADEFIGASPQGVKAGRNDESLKQVMLQGYASYRAIGTRLMRVQGLRVTELDEMYCVAHVDWQATYARESQSDLEIDFTVHYLLQMTDAEPKIFGWISGDEQEVMRQHGIGS